MSTGMTVKMAIRVMQYVPKSMHFTLK